MHSFGTDSREKSSQLCHQRKKKGTPKITKMDRRNGEKKTK